jgi:hypothetical protein
MFLSPPPPPFNPKLSILIPRGNFHSLSHFSHPGILLSKLRVLVHQQPSLSGKYERNQTWPVACTQGGLSTLQFFQDIKKLTSTAKHGYNVHGI